MQKKYGLVPINGNRSILEINKDLQKKIDYFLELGEEFFLAKLNHEHDHDTVLCCAASGFISSVIPVMSASLGAISNRAGSWGEKAETHQHRHAGGALQTTYPLHGPLLACQHRQRCPSCFCVFYVHDSDQIRIQFYH
ncbi:MAG: hypothetical protein WAM14_25440 [Candidatus Nitrosopolaris sp.]